MFHKEPWLFIGFSWGRWGR